MRKAILTSISILSLLVCLAPASSVKAGNPTDKTMGYDAETYDSQDYRTLYGSSPKLNTLISLNICETQTMIGATYEYDDEGNSNRVENKAYEPSPVNPTTPKCREQHNKANQSVLEKYKKFIDGVCYVETADQFKQVLSLSQGYDETITKSFGEYEVTGETQVSPNCQDSYEQTCERTNISTRFIGRADWAYARICATGFVKWRTTYDVLRHEEQNDYAAYDIPYMANCKLNPGNDCGEVSPTGKLECEKKDSNGSCMQWKKEFIEKIVYKVEQGVWYKYVREYNGGKYASDLTKIKVDDIEKEFPRTPQREWMQGWNFGPIQKQIVLNKSIELTENISADSLEYAGDHITKYIPHYKSDGATIYGYEFQFTPFNIDILGSGDGIELTSDPSSPRRVWISKEYAQPKIALTTQDDKPLQITFVRNEKALGDDKSSFAIANIEFIDFKNTPFTIFERLTYIRNKFTRTKEFQTPMLSPIFKWEITENVFDSNSPDAFITFGDNKDVSSWAMDILGNLLNNQLSRGNIVKNNHFNGPAGSQIVFLPNGWMNYIQSNYFEQKDLPLFIFPHPATTDPAIPSPSYNPLLQPMELIFAEMDSNVAPKDAKDPADGCTNISECNKLFFSLDQKIFEQKDKISSVEIYKDGKSIFTACTSGRVQIDHKVWNKCVNELSAPSDYKSDEYKACEQLRICDNYLSTGTFTVKDNVRGSDGTFNELAITIANGLVIWISDYQIEEHCMKNMDPLRSDIEAAKKECQALSFVDTKADKVADIDIILNISNPGDTLTGRPVGKLSINSTNTKNISQHRWSKKYGTYIAEEDKKELWGKIFMQQIFFNQSKKGFEYGCKNYGFCENKFDEVCVNTCMLVNNCAMWERTNVDMYGTPICDENKCLEKDTSGKCTKCDGPWHKPPNPKPDICVDYVKTNKIYGYIPCKQEEMNIFISNHHLQGEDRDMVIDACKRPDSNGGARVEVYEYELQPVATCASIDAQCKSYTEEEKQKFLPTSLGGTATPNTDGDKDDNNGGNDPDYNTPHNWTCKEPASGCANNYIWDENKCKCEFDTGGGNKDDDPEDVDDNDPDDPIVTPDDPDDGDPVVVDDDDDPDCVDDAATPLNECKSTLNNIACSPDYELDEGGKFCLLIAEKKDKKAEGTVSGGCSLTGSSGQSTQPIWLLSLILGSLSIIRKRLITR